MMKRIITWLCIFVLSGTAAFAQNDKCCQGGGCAGKRTEKIAKYLSLDDAKKAELLDLNQKLMSACSKADSKSLSKAEKKEMKAAQKAYAKSLKALVGKKGVRQIKKFDQLEAEAKALKAKQDAKLAKKAARKSSRKK